LRFEKGGDRKTSNGKNSGISTSLFVAGLIIVILASSLISIIVSTQWAKGPKGDKGDIGATGAQGPKGDIGATGPLGFSIAPLPFGATYSSLTTDGIPYVSDIILISVDLDQSTLGNQQSIAVRAGSIIKVTGTFTIYGSSAGDMFQAFFIFSWTPTWPPQNGFYQVLYNGTPGLYPGITQSFSFNVTLPAQFGVYYLYYCGAELYNIQQAIATYTAPLSLPYAVITAGP
jgi:hypothetical protein